MSLEELTDKQRIILESLVSEVDTGRYDEEALWAPTFGDTTSLSLKGLSGHPNKEIPDVGRSDLEELSRQDFINLNNRGDHAFVTVRQAARHALRNRSKPRREEHPKAHPAQVVLWILSSLAIVAAAGWAIFTYLNPRAQPTTQDIADLAKIESLIVEARLTCDLIPGTEIPPVEVPFVPLGDSHSYLEGAAGKAQLVFQSPVRFRQQSEGSVITINRFALPPGGSLQHQPFQALGNYDNLSVPIVTVVYGESFGTIRLLEVIFRINGEDIWYGRWQYDMVFKKSPRFSVPLAQLHQRLQ